MASEPIAEITIPASFYERAARWDTMKRWEKRELGQELRRLGLSYSEIGSIIPVTKGTLSGWCRDLTLTTAQLEALRDRAFSTPDRFKAYRRRRQNTLDRFARIRLDAATEVAGLSRDPFWVAGVVAYWAEGAKRSTAMKFSNSDPALIRLFLEWAQDFLYVSRDRFTVVLHLHSGQSEEDRISFWSRETGIPRSQFGKTYIKAEGTGHRKNTLYQGTASIVVRKSGILLHRVLGWIEAYGQCGSGR